MTRRSTEAPSPRPRQAGARAGVVEFVAEALREPLESDALRVVTVPAARGPAEELLGLAAGPAVFWSLPGGAVHAGLGAAHTVTAAGADRFRSVRSDAATFWARVDTVTHPEATPLAPRLFGGFSFLPGPLPAEWGAFGEATFVLPRLLYTSDAGGSRISLAVSARDVAERGPDGLAGELARMLEAAARGGERGRLPHGRVRAAPEAESEWAEAVSSIQRRIEAGAGEKVVAARRRMVELDGPPDLAPVLRRMARESATAARFVFRLGGSAFVGATPERLVGRTGTDVRTEALAGTVPAGSREREERLLASLKDSVEHEYVVRAIADALAPLCERLEHPSEPRIQRLRHVLHLQTPFVGSLREPVHVLELVERLHPTPAVGGWPTAPALEWIGREEPGSRGWYAAPVGWFDDRGDGEFGVALRSGLIHDDCAYLYAGAGIVRDSDAAAEFAETEVKLRTMMDALGIRP